MKAENLKVGSTIEVEELTTDEQSNIISNRKIVLIERCSEKYVWFQGMGYQRIGRRTIELYPEFYKIVSI